MIRIAILEHEKETKDIVFILARLFKDTDWLFRHYFKASQLARTMKEEEYQVFIFDEMFKSPRLESVFVHDNPDAVFLYICDDPVRICANDQRERVFYIDRSDLAGDLQRLAPQIREQCVQSEVYTLIYDGTHVNIPYQDIYYLEKLEKMVYFHTRMGTFHKRVNMSELEELFAPYGFLRVHVSYLVNRKHIQSWDKADVILTNREVIPLSRSQKRRLRAAMHEKSPA